MTTTAVSTSRPTAGRLSRAAGRVPPAKRALRITFGGLLFGCVDVLVLLAGLNSEANLLLLLFGIGIGALLVNAVLPVLMLLRIDVDRIMPEGVVADWPFNVGYRVRSGHRRLRAWALTVTEVPVDAPWTRFPEAFVYCLPPGREQRVEVLGKCPRRANLALKGIRVSCSFPFGLFACTAEFALPGGLTVYPAIGRLRHDPWTSLRGGQSQSVAAARDRDNPEEFIGVREYREGDNLHWIHWRRSARTGELVVREMIPLRQTRLIIMLDPWPAQAKKPSDVQRAASADDVEAERLISAAATAICEGLERGHRVGLICRAAEPAVIPPGTGKAHRQRLLRELAAIAPGARTAFDELVGHVHWSTGWSARCVLLTTRLQPEHERVARFVGARAEAILVMHPGGESFESLFDLSGLAAPGRRAR